MAEKAKTTISVYLPEHVREALEAEMRASLGEEGAGGGQRESFRAFLQDLLARLLSQGADASLLPQERKMISQASKKYSVRLDLPDEACLVLEEKASKAGKQLNVYASALLLNHCLQDPSARRAHASFFPQSAETRAFVKDGDKSHLLRASTRAGGGGTINYYAIGKVAFKSLRGLVPNGEELERAASLGSEEVEKETREYVKELRNLIEEGKEARELKKENAELEEELKGLSSEARELRDGVKRRDEELKGLKDELRKKEQQLEAKTSELEESKAQFKKREAQLNQELNAEKKLTEMILKEAENLAAALGEFEDGVFMVLDARKDPLLGFSSLAPQSGNNILTAQSEVLKALDKVNPPINAAGKKDLANYITLVIFDRYTHYLLGEVPSSISELAKLPPLKPLTLRTADSEFTANAYHVLSDVRKYASRWGDQTKKDASTIGTVLWPDYPKLAKVFEDLKSRWEPHKMPDDFKPFAESDD